MLIDFLKNILDWLTFDFAVVYYVFCGKIKWLHDSRDMCTFMCTYQ